MAFRSDKALSTLKINRLKPGSTYVQGLSEGVEAEGPFASGLKLKGCLIFYINF